MELVKNCGNCRHPEGGVCYNCEGVNGATEINSFGRCNNWEYNKNLEPGLSFTEYTTDVLRTWKPNQDFKEELTHATLKLAGEAGELANAVGKMVFQGHEFNKEVIIEELGDQLYYIALLIHRCGLTLGDVIDYNVKKRLERYPNGFDPNRSINRGR